MFSIPHPKRLDLSERNHQPNVKLTHKFTTTRPLQILHCKTLVSEESTQPHPPSLSPFKLPLATRGGAIHVRNKPKGVWVDPHLTSDPLLH
jgi:hypothetical protein